VAAVYIMFYQYSYERDSLLMYMLPCDSYHGLATHWS